MQEKMQPSNDASRAMQTPAGSSQSKPVTPASGAKATREGALPPKTTREGKLGPIQAKQRRMPSKQRPVQRKHQQKPLNLQKPSPEELFMRFTDSFRATFMKDLLEHFEQNPMITVDQANRDILEAYIRSNQDAYGLLRDAGKPVGDLGERAEPHRYQLRMTKFHTGEEFVNGNEATRLPTVPHVVVPSGQRMGHITGTVGNLHKFGDVLYIATQSGRRFGLAIEAEVVYQL